jgi:hypothetical protein
VTRCIIRFFDDLLALQFPGPRTEKSSPTKPNSRKLQLEQATASVDSAESVQDVIPQKVDSSKRDAANNRHNDYKKEDFALLAINLQYCEQFMYPEILPKLLNLNISK